MISLKTREKFSSEAIETSDSNDQKAPGIKWPDTFLLTYFVVTFLCRYSQISLLTAVQYDAPISEWFAPDSSLLLFPSALLAIPAGYFCLHRMRSAITEALVALAIGLALMGLAIGLQSYATTLIACCIVLVTGCLELIRTCAWTQTVATAARPQADSFLVQLVLTEVAATALGVNGFRLWTNLLPTAEVLRISSLCITAIFLLTPVKRSLDSFRKSPSTAEKTEASSTPATPDPEVFAKPPRLTGLIHCLQNYPFSSMFLAIAANTTCMTLLILTLANKVVANIAMYSLWSATAIGMIIGAVYCLIPSGKLRTSRLFIALFMSCLSCAFCIYKPTGPTLFSGLLFAGFAAAVTTLTNFSLFMEFEQPVSPALYIGSQTALCCLLSFTIASVLEPRIEYLSSSVFIRLLAISQLIFLTALGALSYILYKYRLSSEQ